MLVIKIDRDDVASDITQRDRLRLGQEKPQSLDHLPYVLGSYTLSVGRIPSKVRIGIAYRILTWWGHWIFGYVLPSPCFTTARQCHCVRDVVPHHTNYQYRKLNGCI